LKTSIGGYVRSQIENQHNEIILALQRIVALCYTKMFVASVVM